MTLAHRSLFIVVAVLALVAAGCGGGGDDNVPSNAIAVVGDEQISRAEFDALMGQAKRSYQQQQRAFPKPGTPQYNQIKTQAVQFLVQRVEFEQKANELGIKVTDKQVDERLDQIKKQYFRGDEKLFQRQLKQQGLTEAQVRRDVRAQLVQEQIFAKVTKDVKVTAADIEKYYKQNKSQYAQRASRDVRHILIGCTSPAQCATAKAKADGLYRRIQGGADFGTLARQFSQDPGSKSMGGKLTVQKGQTVPPFDKVAFSLAKGAVSKPVKTQYGWHIIRAESAVQPARTTPLTKAVKNSIRQQLLQTKKNQKMTKWVEDTRKDFEDDTSFQVGFAPPKTDTNAQKG